MIDDDDDDDDRDADLVRPAARLHRIRYQRGGRSIARAQELSANQRKVKAPITLAKVWPERGEEQT